MPLREIEKVLRDRLAGTLPGIEAQIRFAPELLQKAWRTGQFPATSRPAAALLLLYPHGRSAAVTLTVRSSSLARHPGHQMRGSPVAPRWSTSRASCRATAARTSPAP